MAGNVGYTEGAGKTIASDERTIASTTVHVQRISEIGASSITSGQVTVTSTASNVVADRDTRKRLVIVNQQTVPVYIGPSSVNSNSGLRLDPGASVTLYTVGSVGGITAASYTAGGYDDRVQFIEEHD